MREITYTDNDSLYGSTNLATIYQCANNTVLFNE